MNKEQEGPKGIELTIVNGRYEFSKSWDGYSSSKSHLEGITLKEIAIVIEALKKKQETIMNKQKDDVQKSDVSKGVIKSRDIILDSTSHDESQNPFTDAPKSGMRIWCQADQALIVVRKDGRIGTIKINWLDKEARM